MENRFNPPQAKGRTHEELIVREVIVTSIVTQTLCFLACLLLTDGGVAVRNYVVLAIIFNIGLAGTGGRPVSPWATYWYKWGAITMVALSSLLSPKIRIIHSPGDKSGNQQQANLAPVKSK